MPMIWTPNRDRASMSASSSWLSPLLEIRIATSSAPTIPRSPCTLSTGCRNMAGVPVDVNVAAIFRPTRPDLPTPAMMTRPRHAASNCTARTKSSPKRCSTSASAVASRWSTRFPRAVICSAVIRPDSPFECRRASHCDARRSTPPPLSIHRVPSGAPRRTHEPPPDHRAPAAATAQPDALP